MSDNKMTVLEFVEKYEKLTSEKNRKALVEKIISRTYCPILEKRTVLQIMLDKSVSTEDTGVVYIDMTVSKLNYTMALIILYTDLKMDKKDDAAIVEDMYDGLVRSGALSEILQIIGENELREFDAINQTLIDTFYNKNSSFESFIGRLANNLIDALALLTEQNETKELVN